MYTQLVLILNVYNIVFGQLIVPVWKLFASVIIPAGLIRFRIDSIYEAGILVVLIGSAAMALVPSALVISTVYNFSKMLLPNLKRRLHHISNIESQFAYSRILKSLPVMRCKVGNFYHMESQAKLTLLHTVISGLVFLLVTF